MKRTIESVEKMYSSGMSIRELGITFGISESTMRYWMHKYHIQIRTDRRRWTDEDLVSAVKTASTKSDVLRKLGLAVRPGNYEVMRRHLKRLSVDISHFTGKAHGRSPRPNKRTLSKILTKDSTIWSNTKKRLIEEGVLENTCVICGISQWNNKPIVMILDHINGDHHDCRRENLRMLCPNCNSQQPTFCRKKGKVS